MNFTPSGYLRKGIKLFVTCVTFCNSLRKAKRYCNKANKRKKTGVSCPKMNIFGLQKILFFWTANEQRWDWKETIKIWGCTSRSRTWRQEMTSRMLKVGTRAVHYEPAIWIPLSAAHCYCCNDNLIMALLVFALTSN